MTRGMRNNNPANIRRSASKWLGLRQIQSDKDFCQFTDMKYGVRAFFILMRTYRYKYGLKRVGEIIRRYAPEKENNLSVYLLFLEQHGFRKDDFLGSNSDYCLFAKYVFRYESSFAVSYDWLKEIMINEDCRVVNPLKEYYEPSFF